jgi:hypothetical protein
MSNSKAYLPPHKRNQQQQSCCVPGRVDPIRNPDRLVLAERKDKQEKEESRLPWIPLDGWRQVKQALVDQDDERLRHDCRVFVAMTRLVNSQVQSVMRPPIVSKASLDRLPSSAAYVTSGDVFRFYAINQPLDYQRRADQIAFLQTKQDPDEHVKFGSAVVDPRGHPTVHLLRWMMVLSRPKDAKAIRDLLFHQDKTEAAQAEWRKWNRLTNGQADKKAKELQTTFQKRQDMMNTLDAKWQVSLGEAIHQSCRSELVLKELPNVLTPQTPRVLSEDHLDPRHLPLIQLILQGMASVDVYNKLPIKIGDWLTNKVDPQLKTAEGGDDASMFLSILNRNPHFRRLLKDRIRQDQEEKKDKTRAEELGIQKRHYSAFFCKPRGMYRHITYWSLRQMRFVPKWLRHDSLRSRNRELQYRPKKLAKRPAGWFPHIGKAEAPFDMRRIRRLEDDIQQASRSTLMFELYALQRWFHELDIDLGIARKPVTGRVVNMFSKELGSLTDNTRTRILDAFEALIRDCMNRITDVVEGRGQYNTKTVFEGTGYALWIGLAHVQLPAPSSDPLQVLGQLVKKDKSPILSDTLEEDIARINKMFAPHPLGGMSREVNAQLFECEAWFASFTDFVYSAIMKVSSIKLF